MTRTDTKLQNLANPSLADSAAILGTFTHAQTRKVSVTYKSETKKVTGLACAIVNREIKPNPVPGNPPIVKLIIDLDFLTGIDEDRRQAMRKLIAMDWSQLARYGKPPLPSSVDTWSKNCARYLANYTDMRRAEELRGSIIQRHLGKTAKALATELRLDIDKHLITANHWGELRENMKTEHHQRLLSDVFGSIHQSAFVASPVGFFRGLEKDYKLTLNERAALSLQYGTGHCGEHAIVSYSVLCEILRQPGSKIKHVIFTGNANIDHAFVVYDLDVKEVFLTRPIDPNNTKPPTKTLRVWDLKKAIDDDPTSTGYVMDPYLDPSVMKPTARELLAALNSPKKIKKKKDTNFLAFGMDFPSHYKEIDLTKRPDADLRAIVKHV
jgi:hypothetical protein